MIYLAMFQAVVLIFSVYYLVKAHLILERLQDNYDLPKDIVKKNLFREKTTFIEPETIEQKFKDTNKIDDFIKKL